MALNKKAQYVMNQFAQNPDIGSITSASYQNLANVIERSPVLEQQFNQMAAELHVTKIGLLDKTNKEGANFAASDKTIKISLETLNNPAKERSLIFQLGHEFDHAHTQKAMQKEASAVSMRITAMARSGGEVHDYSAIQQAALDANSKNEASAHIAGWNALVSREAQINPNLSLEYLYDKSGYMEHFIDEKRLFGSKTYELKEGLSRNTDFSMNASPENIKAMEQHYFYRSPKETGIGPHGNSDYANILGTSLIRDICRAEMGANEHRSGTPPKIMLNMEKMNEALIEQNGLNLGKVGNTCTYYDKADPDTPRQFNHTIDGPNKNQHVPSASPAALADQKAEAFSSGDSLFDALYEAAKNKDQGGFKEAMSAISNSEFGQQVQAETKEAVEQIKEQQALALQAQELQQQQEQSQQVEVQAQSMRMVRQREMEAPPMG